MFSPMNSRRFARYIPYWWAFCSIFAVAFVAGFIEPYLGYRTVGFVFLLAVLGIGFYNSLGPVLFAAGLSAAIWNLFFLPPRFTFAISNPEDMALCAGYFVAAAVTGLLTSRSRRHEAAARENEQRTLFLYEVMKDILELSKPEEFIQRISWRVEELLNGTCRIELSPGPATVSGWDLEGRKSVFGRLIFAGSAPVTPEQEVLLQAAARQIGLALERLQMESRLRETQKLEESERLHQTLLNSVSHELRTPLTSLMGFATSLREPAADAPEFRRTLASGLIDASERMNRVIGNLLDMSRISSGAISLKREWHDLNDLVGVVLNANKNELREFGVKVQLPARLPLIQIDFRLMETTLSNLVLNAAAYAKPGSEIQIEACTQSDALALSVNDSGPGIAAAALPHLFEKFYRAPGTPPGGTGLGLSIVKAFVELHDGTVHAENRPEGGARFTILLPLGTPPEFPEEDLNG